MEILFLREHSPIDWMLTLVILLLFKYKHAFQKVFVMLAEWGYFSTFRVPDFHHIFVVHTSDTYDCIIFAGMFPKLLKRQLCVDFSFLGTCGRFWNLLKIWCQENYLYWIFLRVIPLIGRCEHQHPIIGWAMPYQTPTFCLVPCSCVVGVLNHLQG